MKQKTLYTCEVCHTDYNDPDKATECENSHSLPESVASYKFLPYCEYPERVQIKFKNGKRIEYTSFQSIKFIPASLLSTKKRLLIFW